MVKENQAQAAVADVRDAIDAYVTSFKVPATARIEVLASIAELEVRAAQVKQHELQNMIAMAANPALCPYPIAVVHARIKELANLE